MYANLGCRIQSIHAMIRKKNKWFGIYKIIAWCMDRAIYLVNKPSLPQLWRCQIPSFFWAQSLNLHKCIHLTMRRFKLLRQRQQSGCFNQRNVAKRKELVRRQHDNNSSRNNQLGLFVWLVAGAGLFWEESTAGWLLVAGLFWDKSTAGWWLRSQENGA
jgi:hypothetical protein